MSLLSQGLHTKDRQQPITPEQLAHLSATGIGIHELARDNWHRSTALISTSLPTHATRESNLKLILHRERSFLTSLVAAGAVILLHLMAAGNSVTSDEGENALVPVPGTAKYLNNMCQKVYQVVRTAINYHSSTNVLNASATPEGMSYGTKAPQLSPCFSCIQRIVAMGSFLALTRSPSHQGECHTAVIARASLVLDFQLSESAITRQCLKWANSKIMLKEIGSLKKKMQTGITGGTGKSLIAAGRLSPQA